MATDSLRTTARRTVRRIPVLGTGLRYLKRAITLPWNFHKHYQASNAFNAQLFHTVHTIADTQRQAAADLANQQTHALAEHTRTVLFEQVPPLLHRHMESVRGDVLLVVAEVAAEMQSLNDRHAGCYDRLNETARDQAAELRRLTDTLAQLTARLEDLAARVEPQAPAVLRRAG